MYVHLYNDCHSLLRNPLFVRYFLQSTENSIESSIRTLFIYWPYAYSFLYNSMSLYLSKPMRYFFVIHSKLALYSIYNSYNVAYLFPVNFFRFFLQFSQDLIWYCHSVVDSVLSSGVSVRLAAWFPLCVKTELKVWGFIPVVKIWRGFPEFKLMTIEYLSYVFVHSIYNDQNGPLD